MESSTLNLIVVVILMALPVGVAAPAKQEEDEDNTQRMNIYAGALRKCDRPAALRSAGITDTNFPHTGFTRDDHCGSMTQDHGTHYVCVELPSAVAASGDMYSPFWTKTGQAQNAEDAVGWPKPGPWCICMWAFARMYQQHPDFSTMLDCNATNYWVVQMYDLANVDECVVLREICSHCNLPSRAQRENIRLKCNMTKQLCPAQADEQTCSAREGCVGSSQGSASWLRTLQESWLRFFQQAFLQWR